MVQYSQCLPECQDGERSVGLVGPPVPDVDTPEIIVPHLTKAGLTRDISVVDNGGNIIMDKVTVQAVAVDKQ